MRLFDAIELVGLAVACAGVFLLSLEAGLIVSGLALVAVGNAPRRRER